MSNANNNNTTPPTPTTTLSAQQPPPPPPAAAVHQPIAEPYWSNPIAVPPQQCITPEVASQITGIVIQQLNLLGVRISPLDQRQPAYHQQQWPTPTTATFLPPEHPPPNLGRATPQQYQTIRTGSAGEIVNNLAPPLPPRLQAQQQQQPNQPNNGNTSNRGSDPRPDNSGGERSLTPLEKIWGNLFDNNDRPTERLGQLLHGIAVHLVSSFTFWRKVVTNSL